MRFATASLCLIVFCHSGLRAEPASAPASSGKPDRTCQLQEQPGSPTWQAIGTQYSRLARAIQRKDFDAIVALYAPSFEVAVPKSQSAGRAGAVWNREQSLAYQRAGLERVKETRLASNTITRLLDCGDRAVATVLQQWYRTQMMAGSLHTVETAAVQDEEWVKTPDGWKRRNTGNVHPGAWVVDGKRVDPAKGYDPAAPPYDPFPENNASGS